MVYLETMYTITLSGELIEKFKAWTSEHACQRGIARVCVLYLLCITYMYVFWKVSEYEHLFFFYRIYEIDR